MSQEQTRWVVTGTRTIAPGYYWQNLSENYGAAIWIYSGTVNGGGSAEERVAFTANTATTTEGGAIQIRSGAVLNLTAADFTENAAATNGGAINNSGNATLQDVVFTGNSAAKGGAIYSARSAALTISGATFSGNSASTGGAIHTDGTITLANVVFDGNSASSAGGAVYGLGRETAETYAKIRLAGKITLATESDTLKGYHTTISVDSASFGSDAYYLVIEAYDKSNWNTLTVNVDGDYTKETIGNNLYIKSTTADFTTAVFSETGTQTQAVIAGQTFTGVAYDADDTAVAKAFNASNLAYDYTETRTLNEGVTVAGAKSFAVRNGNFDGITTRAITNSGYLSLEDVTFSNNSTTGNYGGAIYSTGGTISLADVTFDGNAAATNGGAMALYNTKVFLKGKVTLATASDKIFSMGSNTFTIDAASFGDGAYYLVIEAYDKSNWNTLTVNVDGDYTKETIGNNLYIKSTTADFTTAVFSETGTQTQAVIAGQTFTGVAYDADDTAVAKAFNASNLAYDYAETRTLNEGVTVAGAKSFAVRNGKFDGITTRAITNSGYLSLEDVTFSNNSTTGNYGGAIYSTGGTISLADVTFDGNAAATNGGAMALYNTKVFLKGKVTLATASDKIFSMGSNTFTIDAASFGDGAYYQVIDALSATQWSPASGASVIGNYTAVTAGSDLYIKRTGEDFSTAVFSETGTQTQAVIAGQTFTGIAYDADDTAVAKAFNASNLAYDYAETRTLNEGVTVAGAKSFAVRNGKFDGITTRAITNSGYLSLEDVTFSNNSTTENYGGAIYSTGGTISLADVTFDGNAAATNGGAMALYNTKVFLKGKVTLATASDKIFSMGSNSFTIDAASFGDGAYYQVIDASDSSTQWSPASGASVIGDYTAVKIEDQDLYIKRNGVDFTTAIFSDDASATEVVIVGETFTGVGYLYADTAVAKAFNASNFVYDGFAAPVGTRMQVNSGEGYHVLNGEFRNSNSTSNGAAVYNAGAASFEGTLFSGNTSTADGGAICSLRSASLKISGSTFSKNVASTGGGAIITYGDITLADVIFDGNTAAGSGGAVYSIGGETAETYATMTLKGKISLVTATDTLRGYHTNVVVDAASFGDGAYYQVIDAYAAENWNTLQNNISVIGDYEKATIGSDLYIKSTTADFTTAIFSNGGTSSSVEIGGETLSGIAYDFSLQNTAKNWGAVNFAYDGYTTASDLTVTGGTITGNTTIAFKGSSIGGNYYSYANYSVVNGNVTFLMEGSTFSKAVYGAGNAATSGIVTLKISGSTIGGNLSPTSSAAEKESEAFLTELTNSRVNGQLRGTGSSGSITVGSVSVTMNNSYAGNVIAAYGNTVNGNAEITLTGSSVGGDIRRFASGKSDTILGDFTLTVNGANTVDGDIIGTDTITVNAGATLNANSISTAANFVNNGTVTVCADSTITVAASNTLGNLTVNGGTLTVSVTPVVSSGVTYSTVALADGAALAASGNAVAYTKESTGYLAYYNVVDSTLGTHSKGDIVDVVINGSTTKAIYGVNAFASRSSIDNSLATVVANEEIKTDTNLGGGTNVITSGTTLTANLYGGSDSTVSNVDLTLRGASSSATVLGGGSTLESKVEGNIKLTLEDATVDRIVYGGGQSGTVTGSITTTVSGDGVIGKNFYGGSLITCDAKATEFDMYSAGDVTVNITGGTFGGHVIGGSRVNGVNNKSGKTLSQNVKSVTLNISGGSFKSTASIFAGGYVIGNGTKDKTALNVLNGVNLTLNTDMLTTSAASGIYGGALAGSYGTASIGKDTSTYAVQITVEGGHYSAIYGAGWAESNATSLVSGGIAINVNGGSIGNLYAGGNNDTSGAKANANGDAVITLAGGTVDNVYASSKWKTSKIDGNTEVNITGGTITGMLSGWTPKGLDAVTGTQTLDLDASISCEQVLGFDVWEIAAGNKLTATSSLEAIDLEDVTLKFDTGTRTSGWGVVEAAAGIINLAEADVWINNIQASYTEGVWSTDSWALSSLSDNTLLKLTKLA